MRARNEHDSDEEIGRHEREFDALLEVFCKRYQVSKEEIPKLIERARWAGVHRDGINRVSWYALLGAVVAIITGFMMMVGEGLKHYVKSLFTQ